TDRVHHLLLIKRRPPTSPLFPYTTLFRSEATTASTSSQRDKTFPTSSRPAHGAGARRLCGAACLLSSPRLAAPGGALGGCGHEVGEPLCGWGGRLHGFRQPLWGEPRRSWPQRRALTGRSTDCPPRPKLTGP